MLWKHIRTCEENGLQLTYGHYKTEHLTAGRHVWVNEATIFISPQNPLGSHKFPTVPFTAHQSGRRGAGAWLSGVSAAPNTGRIWSSCLGAHGLCAFHLLHINDGELWSDITTHSCIKETIALTVCVFCVCLMQSWKRFASLICVLLHLFSWIIQHFFAYFFFYCDFCASLFSRFTSVVIVWQFCTISSVSILLFLSFFFIIYILSFHFHKSFFKVYFASLFSQVARSTCWIS